MNAPETKFDVLSNVVLMDFVCSSMSPEKTLDTNEFIRNVGKLLPASAFSWVNTFRNRAKKALLQYGVGRKVNERVRGYFVPADYATQTAAELLNIKRDYMIAKQEFLRSYPTMLEEWANETRNQESANEAGETRADLIRRLAPSMEDMDSQLTFDISAIRIENTPLLGEQDALHKEVTGMVGQAAQEIAEDVTKSWTKPDAGRTTSRVLGLVKRVRTKAQAMSILSEKFGRLATLCDEVLAVVPSNSAIEGRDFLYVKGLLERCRSVESILSDEEIRFDPSEGGISEVKSEAPPENQGTLPLTTAVHAAEVVAAPIVTPQTPQPTPITHGATPQTVQDYDPMLIV